MRFSRLFLVTGFWLIARLGWSQAAFQATWSFENTTAGNSSNPLVTANAMTTTGVNVASLSTVAYPSGQVGRAVSIQNWSTAVCNNTEYVEFRVQPTGGAPITLTSLSFYVSRSAQGPVALSVRSSADGFAADLTTLTVTETYQAVTIPLSGPGFIGQTGAISFRIYACNPASGGGTLRLDEVNLNGSVLPVDLLYFRAQVVNNRVELAWATTFERNANRFIVERSRDLREFGALGSVLANGTTDQTQRYTFTDAFPDGGTTYYRLAQVDDNGTTTYTKPVAVLLDDQTPALTLLGNPTDGAMIRVAARNLTSATFALITLTGQRIPLQPTRQADGSYQLTATQQIPTGWYLLWTEQGGWRWAERLFIHE